MAKDMNLLIQYSTRNLLINWNENRIFIVDIWLGLI